MRVGNAAVTAYLSNTSRAPAALLWQGVTTSNLWDVASSFTLKPIISSLRLGLERTARRHVVMEGNGSLRNVPELLSRGDLLVYIGVVLVRQNMEHMRAAMERGTYVVLYDTDSQCETNNKAIAQGDVAEVWDYSLTTFQHCMAEDVRMGRPNQSAVHRYLPPGFVPDAAPPPLGAPSAGSRRDYSMTPHMLTFIGTVPKVAHGRAGCLAALRHELTTRYNASFEMLSHVWSENSMVS